ncbi:2OG-Fe(II) oxygenase [Qipengyuania aquimaris]|uniref:2OG-Fe(II) oxygenase n=1 Tax=Qipengyuania aquimaris TaxID=255984 RepID=A0A9Q3RYW0_9SPHN|nr:2OG-Fe(II) oxygenase family protein [Qipengyuania aquimaris]MBY6217055.1 2OG-Fe(II) oxygenase [Qipengyuania aquimaris]
MALKKLFEINPDLDREALAKRFAEHGRVQVRNVLTEETAREIQMILARGTKWGMAVQAGDGPGQEPQSWRMEEIQAPGGAEKVNAAANAAHQASAKGDYAFRFAQYPILTAVQEGWDPGGPHELLLEYINAPEFLDLARDITGTRTLTKADGQASLYAPNHYLGRHIDSHVAEGWRYAYVLNFARDDWHPDWGGYLNFLDEDGDIVEGFRPRFNALNLFAVPTSHQVSYVPPFAPMGRTAIVGWIRDQ